MGNLLEIFATLIEFFAFALLAVVVFYVSTVALCCAGDLRERGRLASGRFWHRVTTMHKPRHRHIPAWR